MAALPEDLKNLQFLVADDYESMRLLISMDLRKLGVTKILFAKSGNEAIKTIKDNLEKPTKIDFLLTDMMMPDGSGLDVVKSVRGEMNLKKLPILMITSTTEVSAVIECVKAGINNYIVKPWDIEDFAKKLQDSHVKANK